MARASAIWIVVEPDYDGDDIVAAFTVKHECVSYLHRSKHTWTGRVRHVMKLADGQPDASVEDFGSETAFLKACGHGG
ncbi:hypothetical protein BSL82_03885 [Tardibacter chloracetimidivorans]|uniref:Uncharacterized protein n=1 Tax=Tardibacter chloracetimidivorans TaxID=1921510 RepID=A0A1L3ZSF6_9SPHN|nr:hypothetical protein [Tardibacter chloracetimidivorans]API58558.1 hypothetical protein BSL82_03885 [Tardibacter chloracetimidivorans]